MFPRRSPSGLTGDAGGSCMAGTTAAASSSSSSASSSAIVDDTIALDPAGRPSPLHVPHAASSYGRPLARSCSSSACLFGRHASSSSNSATAAPCHALRSPRACVACGLMSGPPCSMSLRSCVATASMHATSLAHSRRHLTVMNHPGSRFNSLSSGVVLDRLARPVGPRVGGAPACLVAPGSGRLRRRCCRRG